MAKLKKINAETQRRRGAEFIFEFRKEAVSDQWN